MRSIDPGRILYEDSHLIAVHKLSGELVVRGRGPVGKLPLFDFLRQKYPGIHPLHRLDFATSGVVVFARSRGVLAKVIKSKFAGWKKEYVALIVDRLKAASGEMKIPLPARSSRGVVDTLTRYRRVERFKDIALVRVELERGQRHQIRRHFASIHCPLVLDEEYGDVKINRAFTREFTYRRFFLHASAVEFPHPVTGKHVRIEAPMPKTFEDVLSKLRQ